MTQERAEIPTWESKVEAWQDDPANKDWPLPPTTLLIRWKLDEILAHLRASK